MMLIQRIIYARITNRCEDKTLYSFLKTTRDTSLQIVFTSHPRTSIIITVTITFLTVTITVAITVSVAVAVTTKNTTNLLILTVKSRNYVTMATGC